MGLASELRLAVGFDDRYEGWLQVGGYVLAAVVATTRPFAHEQNGGAWALVAGALALRATASWCS